MNDATNTATANIARDLDEGAVRSWVLHFEIRGGSLADVSVNRIADETGLPSNRVYPHWCQIVSEKLREMGRQ